MGAGTDLIFTINLAATGWPFLTERYFRRFTFGSIGDLEGSSFTETKDAGEDGVGKLFALGIVHHYRIIEGLPGECDAVLGGGQSLLE